VSTTDLSAAGPPSIPPTAPISGSSPFTAAVTAPTPAFAIVVLAARLRPVVLEIAPATAGAANGRANEAATARISAGLISNFL
jgi:hypothetical protein